MKTTGMVRRIDSLGRVVIPKEIRRTMRIRQGDMLEIYTDKEDVIFRKFSSLDEFSQIAENFAEAVNKACGLSVIITDKDTVVAYAGIPKAHMSENTISAELEEVIDSRQLYTWQTDNKKIKVNNRQDKYFVKTAMPIFSEGDAIGAVAAIEADNLLNEADGAEIQIVKTAAIFIGRQLDS